jgi:hypothetical protein
MMENWRGATPEQTLWVHVIANAVRDATMRFSYLTSYNTIMLRENARAYLRGESKGFLRVCDYAGVLPDRVRAMLELAIASDKHEARNQRIVDQRIAEAVGRLENTRKIKTLAQKRKEIRAAIAAIEAGQGEMRRGEPLRNSDSRDGNRV